MLRLNEFLPDPTQGKEWIEIVTLDASNPIPLAGCELRDSIGRIFTFTEGLLSPTSTHFIIELPSAKLNNGGDTLSLYSPSGQPLDSFTYTDSNKGQSWIRFPDGNGNWQQTLTPTPANTNILVSLPSTTSSTTNPTTSATIPITEANGTTAYAVTTAKIGTDNLSAADQLAGETVPIEPSLDSQLGSSLLDEETLTDLLGFEALIPIADKKPTLAKKTTTNSTTKTKTTASKKPNTKKSTPKSKATPKPAPLTITSFPMLNDLPSNMRVRVSGRVATRSGFLPNHAIVLLSPDGHGLLTTLPRSRKLPLPGTQLMVSGSISFSDRNTITLHVGTKDDYLERAASEIEALPRLVDILTPSAEDAWSLIHVTGTVITAKTNAITLDLQDSEVTIAIRPGVNYRAARVKPGDTITVSGVLDMDHETLRILPRTSEDIQLIQHAPTKTSATATPEPINLPPWTPFGAAAGAIAASEGVKRARQKFIQKKLERKLLALTKTHPTITA